MDLVIRWLVIAVLVLIAAYLLALAFRYLIWLSHPEVRRALPEYSAATQEVVASPPESVSRARAEERRQAILAALQRAGLGPRVVMGEGLAPLPHLFSEAPPGYEQTQPEFPTPQSQADAVGPFGQTVRLYWQLGADELLLADRVVDAIAAIDHRYAPTAEPLSHVVVKLVQRRRRGLLPWKVVIETLRDDLYRQELVRLGDWLGIGVDFSPFRSEISQLGACSVGGGMSGLVGGCLSDEAGVLFGVTSAHVLSATCSHLTKRCDPRTSAGQSPDAALLQDASRTCFRLNVPGSQYRCASSEEIDAWMGRRPVTKRHPDTRTTRGLIRARVFTFRAGGALYRFPHLEVRPDTRGPGWRVWRTIWPEPFSHKGDSGCWVFDDQSPTWVGMVTAGYQAPEESFVAEAAPLKQFLEACLGCRQGMSALRSW